VFVCPLPLFLPLIQDINAENEYVFKNHWAIALQKTVLLFPTGWELLFPEWLLWEFQPQRGKSSEVKFDGSTSAIDNFSELDNLIWPYGKAWFWGICTEIDSTPIKILAGEWLLVVSPC
jgi:hypothetical protein